VKRQPPFRRTVVRFGIVSAYALVAHAAAHAADEPNPYSLGVLETISHDSNVFRAASGTPVAADWISTTGLVGTLDQPIGRERLKASGEFDINRFRNQTQLNSTAHTLSIEGDWATIDHLSGEIGYEDSSQLYRYNLDSFETRTAKNTLDTHSGFARFHLGVVTKVTIDAAVEGLWQEYSADAFRYRDMHRWAASLGASYQSSPDLRTSLTFRRTRGEYPHYLTLVDPQGTATTEPDRFTRNDVILGIVYSPSGASRLSLNVSKAIEDHSLISSRSFNTWAADGRWDWAPTGRTHFTFDFIRDDDTGTHDTSLFGEPLASTDATRRTAFIGRVAYELTGKITLTASGSYAHRDLDTAFAAIPGADTHAHDKLYQASLGLKYAATRALQLGCNASREHRSVEGSASGFVTYPYDATVLSCTGQFTFN